MEAAIITFKTSVSMSESFLMYTQLFAVVCLPNFPSSASRFSKAEENKSDVVFFWVKIQSVAHRLRGRFRICNDNCQNRRWPHLQF